MERVHPQQDGKKIQQISMQREEDEWAWYHTSNGLSSRLFTELETDKFN